MTFRTLLLTLAAAVLPAAGARAGNGGDDVPRRWAVTAGMGLACPTSSSHAPDGSACGNAASFGSPGFTVMVERYLPGTHFSLVGGYAGETVEFFSGDVSATMHNVTAGARYYPLSPACAIQPYAQVSALVNVGSVSQQGSLTCSGTDNYRRDYTVGCPRVSAMPAVGADVYILSSLALELQYGFALAVDGKARVSTTPAGQAAPAMTRSNMHRHAVAIGLKLTLPFSLSDSDCCNIIDMLFGVYGSDGRQHEKKVDRKRARLQHVLDSY